jgi:nucleoside-diphosphate-sugar epimerase
MKVLVTGAAGFVGSQVASTFAGEGHQVAGLDALIDNYDPAIKRANLEEVLAERPGGSGALRFVELDLRHTESLTVLLQTEAPDLVVHCAGLPGVRRSTRQPTAYVEHNLAATASLLEAMRAAECRRLLFTSSSSIYGRGTERRPVAEDRETNRPISPYAATKRACELLIHSWHQLYGMSAVAVRLFTVYGPRQRPDLAIHKFVARLEQGRPIPVFGDGSSSRDYTHVLDVAAGLRSAARHLEAHPNRFDIVNLGSERPVELRELIAKLEHACGRVAKVEERPEQPGDATHTCADLARARALLGYAPQVPLEEGLSDFVAWWRRRFGGAG